MDKKGTAKKTTKKAAMDTSTRKTTGGQKANAASAAADQGRCGGRTCRIESCKRTYRAKGYCTFHYKQWRQGKFGVARYKSCGESSCFKPMGLNRHGYCEEHYQNFYVKGMEKAKAAPAAAPAKEKPAAEEKVA